MENKNLWNDAAKYGALIALTWIVFQVIGMYAKSGFVGFVSLVAYVVMLYFFTKRRAMLYGAENGYSYGRCLSYILCMMLFAGVLGAVYEFAAASWLFPEVYENARNTSLIALENTGFYTTDQLDMVASVSEKFYSSPLFLLFSNILRALLKGLFFGLFIAAMVKRNPNIFAQNNE